ncbi:hypothetical protein LSH36_15g00029 [Paralvinella palmiformis]|uniref:Uncharacterized protein n=1 Tax=Paralvinella palmiformis TaxID=53620 RepID=A0AAD9NFY4_9ANNE|nr:hypothetical protein LSH36_15g00029 [Paralvinella palmiformis]
MSRRGVLGWLPCIINLSNYPTWISRRDVPELAASYVLRTMNDSSKYTVCFSVLRAVFLRDVLLPYDIVQNNGYIINLGSLSSGELLPYLSSPFQHGARSSPYPIIRPCESIEVKGRLDGIVDTNKSCYFEADHSKRMMRNMYIRALRLWVIPKCPGEPPEPQQIGYINVIPARNDGGIFDSFGDTVRKFNMHLRQRPLPAIDFTYDVIGRILNMESQEMKFHEWGVGVDPDESCWVESVKFNVSFLVVIRVFYEIGLPGYEEIGCADFVPSCLDPGSQFAGAAEFESFGEVVQKANSWVRQQQNVRVTNVQSIDYKVRHGSEVTQVDTQRSFFVESGRYTTRYLRILRVCFVRSYYGSPPPVSRPIFLNYVTFEPVMLSSGGIIGIPVFETLAETMRRAMAWLNKTRPDVRIVSCESVPIRMFSGNQYGNHEITYTWNRGEQKEFWLLVLRIFLDGEFEDPPPEMLPPPTLEDRESQCCTLS